MALMFSTVTPWFAADYTSDEYNLGVGADIYISQHSQDEAVEEVSNECELEAPSAPSIVGDFVYVSSEIEMRQALNLLALLGDIIVVHSDTEQEAVGIALSDSFAIDSPLIVDSSVPVLIDGRGHTIQSFTSDVIHAAGGHLTLENITIQGPGAAPDNINALAADGSFAPAYVGIMPLSSALVVFSGQQVTIGAGFTATGHTSSGVRVEPGGELTMNSGASITGNSGSSGGGVRVNDFLGTQSILTIFTMNGGTISNNTAATGAGNNRGGVGGGVAMHGGLFNMHGGTISNNTVTTTGIGANHGGGVAMAGGGATGSGFNMTGGIISGNTGAHWGGGVDVESTPFTMTGDSIITGNSAVNGGGVGLHAGAADGFTMYDGEISDNTATNGGGVAVSDWGLFTLNGGTIIDNTATTGIGGGVHVPEGTFRINGGSITENNGSGVHIIGNGFFPNHTITGGYITNNTGRGMHIANGADVIMDGGTISGNIGGGVDVYTSSGFSGNTFFTMESGIISNNGSSAIDGGAVRLYGGGGHSRSRFTMTGGSVSENTANNGGGVYARYGGLTMSGGSITGNTASNGGGIALRPYSGINISNGIISNNIAIENGGGLHLIGVGYASGASIVGGTISGNIANNGGGIHAEAGFFVPGADHFLAISTPVIMSGNVARNGMRINTPLAIDSTGIIPGTTSVPQWWENADGTTFVQHRHAFTNHDINVASGDRAWQVLFEQGSPSGTVTARLGISNQQIASGDFVMEDLNVRFLSAPATGHNFELWHMYTTEAENSNLVPQNWVRGGTGNNSENEEITVTINAHTRAVGNFDSLPDWIRLNNAINDTTAEIIRIHPSTATIDEGIVGNVFNLVIQDDGQTNTINTVPIPGATADNPHRISVTRAVTLEATTDADIVLQIASGDGDIGRHFIVGASGNFILQGGAGTLTLDGGADEYIGLRGGIATNDYFVINAGVTIGNNRAANGGGVAVISGTFTMTGGDISRNTAFVVGGGASGGGVYIGSESTFIMYDGVIDGNYSSGSGDGVRVGSGGTFIMNGGEITNHDINGVFVMGNFTMSGGEITNSGDGVYLFGQFIMNDGTISENQRGVYMVGGDFVMNGGAINNNISSTGTAGVDVTDGGTFTMYGGAIIGNISVFSTVSVWSSVENESTFIMTDGTISNNTTANGGTVTVSGESTITMIDGTITSNTATSGGGVRMLVGGTFNMTGGSITNNTAVNGGGIYIAHDNTPNRITNITIGNDAIFSGNVATSGLAINTPLAQANNPGITPGAVTVPQWWENADDAYVQHSHAFTNHDINAAGEEVWQVFFNTGRPEGTVSAHLEIGDNVQLIRSGDFVISGTPVHFTATPDPEYDFEVWYVSRTTTDEYGVPVNFVRGGDGDNAIADEITLTIDSHTHVVGNFETETTTSNDPTTTTSNDPTTTTSNDPTTTTSNDPTTTTSNDPTTTTSNDPTTTTSNDPTTTTSNDPTTTTSNDPTTTTSNDPTTTTSNDPTTTTSNDPTTTTSNDLTTTTSNDPTTTANDGIVQIIPPQIPDVGGPSIAPPTSWGPIAPRIVRAVITTSPAIEIDDMPPIDAMPISSIHHAYIIGFDDGTVRPHASLTRAQATTIFFRLVDDNHRTSIWSQSSNFGDVSLPRWYNNSISTMANGGMVHGFPDGNFRPQQSITRAEFATMLARFMGVGRSADTAPFNDTAGHWASGYINTAFAQNWIAGFADGTFRPEQAITRAEVAAIVNRALGRRLQSVDDLLPGMLEWRDNANVNAWYYLYIQEATNTNYHEMKADGIHKRWVQLAASRNWTVLERPESRPQDILR